MNRPEAVNEQKLETVLKGSIDSLSHVVDVIQNLLEGIYGLSDLRLQRASRFLWPRKRSAVLKHNFGVGNATGTNFSTDWDMPVGAWRKEMWSGTDWGRQSDWERKLIRFNPRRIIQGRFRFQDLHPVLYVAPEHAEHAQGVTSLDQMLTEQRVESMELITMGVSMFLNANTQHLLYQEMPGRITGYGMTLVDFYHVVRETERGSAGRIELMRTLFGRQRLGQEAFNKSIEAIKKGELYINPLAEHYTESADAFEGFIYYLIDVSNLRKDISPELKRFYRLKGIDKKNFLRNLYNQRVEEGDERYLPCARQLSYPDRYDDYRWGYVDHRYEGL
jgi:hypothetical protein